ncbi:peptidase domain-containing ABC transporter [Neisseria wadsworthii]|uniref:Cyclolysin secretion/processing ATP-binding protein CyaB n=1 Tax=Neisseria wadsworthii 9715 TaxID=1030841 RepID=G4CTC3_9NEIS|nr:peptidase domain-containing ABC transporter [Neisseria wadsworthii]EGZ44287.1 ABC superfamily ATP binding cassette transporter [Neisseria wadsworthii 9715]QMT35916.1 peptidase domain-containing ABC transporter [Neisseria wadsworthii]
MNYLERLSFGFGKKLPVVLQTEIAECGLACLTAIAGYHGYHTDLRTMRHRYSLSQKGSTLADIVRFANDLNLTSRALRLDLDDLGNLRVPCILHWDLNHFVVLKEVVKDGIVIMDPGMGMRKIKLEEVSQKFTGIALELWPNTHFEEKEEKQKVRILTLLKGVTGIKRSLAQVLILAVVLEIFTLVSPFLMQWVIDHVVLSADKNLLITLVLAFGLLKILEQLTSLLQAWVNMHLATTLNVQWKANMFKRLLELPADYFSKRHLGDVISRFGSIDSIQETLTSTAFKAVLSGIMAIFTLVLMFLYSWLLSVVVLVALVLYIIIRIVAYYPLRNATEENIVHEAKQNTYFMETVRGIHTVKLFEKNEQRHSSWMTLFVDTVNTNLTTQKLTNVFDFANKLLFGIEGIVIIYLGANDILDGVFSVGALTAFWAYKNQFETRIGELIDQFIKIKMLSLHAERLADIVLTETETEKVEEMFVPEIEGDLNIEVNNVSFRYSDNEPYILQNINLNIKQGESVAFIGSSGCGKSTLMNILIGNLKPETGTVMLNGHDIHKTSPRFIRGLIGTVTQDDVLFAGSISENICFFDESPDQQKIVQCAAIARIHEDIMRMPMTYETLIGDMGSALSGGQKQRIILARALYKEPKILFLDEATSNLDVENERAINENLKNLNVTKIVVAHRKETIDAADRVLDFEKGF